MSFVVEAEGLVRDFGEVRALDGLSFQVKKGEIYGLIGSNGLGNSEISSPEGSKYESYASFCWVIAFFGGSYLWYHIHGLLEAL